MKKMMKNTWLTDCAWLIAGIGFIYSLFLGVRALGNPDEARYSEIPREMIRSGHFLIPHLDGIKYFEKPDLFYWLQALSIKLWGLSEWALRFWPAAFGVLSAIAVYLAARKLYGRRAGICAAIVLASSSLHYALSHLITIDMSVSFFISASLLCFIVAVNFQFGQKRRILIYLAAVMAALAMLSKGLIGFVFPCMIVFAWLLVTNEWRLLGKIYLISAILIFTAVALPWHLLMAQAQPGWAHFYFITQQFARYATPIAGRPGPIWFFTVILIVGFFPWVVFLPQAIKYSWPTWRERATYRNEIYLLLWPAIILVFFSLSQSKLIPYILPAMPPLAILLGKFLAEFSSRRMRLLIHYLIIQLVGVIFVCGLIIAPFYEPIPDKSFAYFIATLCGILLLFGPLTVYWFSRVKNSKPTNNDAKRFFIGLALLMALFLPLANLSSGYYYNDSIKPLAEKVRPMLKPDDIAIDYRHYYQDLPFYLRRRVVLTRLADELEFGATLQPMQGWVWSEKTLAKRWQGPEQKRLFVFMSLDDYQLFKQQNPTLKIYPIAQTQEDIVISNQENPQ